MSPEVLKRLDHVDYCSGRFLITTIDPGRTVSVFPRESTKSFEAKVLCMTFSQNTNCN